IRIGYFFMLAAVAFNVAYHAFLPPSLPWTVAPMFFFTFGSSLIAPGATLLALDLFPHIRGTVASCKSFHSTLLGAVVARVVAPILSHSVLALAIGQMFFVLLSLAFWDTARRHRRKLRARGEHVP